MKGFLFFLICLLASPVYAQIEPSVTLDPSTGNYLIRYQGEDGNLVELFFEPATKIEPRIKASVLRDSDSYNYEYTVSNGSASRQRILNFAVRILTPIESVTKPNQEWRTGQYSSPSALYWAHTLRDPSGLSTPYDGIAPDSTVSGFSFTSFGLPTIVTSHCRGSAPLSVAFPDEPPEKIVTLLRPLRQFSANTVPGKTIGPNPPSADFVATAFLDTLISYTSRSRTLGWITTQPIANKYEDHFNSVRTKLQQDNIATARTELQTVLQEVEQDSPSFLTSEAYALLRYNTEYLLDQLPEQSSGIAVLATHSIWLEQNSEILSGSVVVNESGDPPFLDSQVALSVGIGSSVAAGYDLKANSIKVKQGATVAGNVYYNELSNNGTVTGTLNTPLTLPVLSTLPPPFQTGTPGSENINLAQNEERTLAPGNYADIVVKMGGKLIFTGGIYNLRSINAGDNTHLVFRAASQVRIAEKFETGQGSFIGPETGAAINARDIVFYVAGINGANGNLGATPKAAKVGLSNTVFANFYVPNGTLWLRQGSVVEGAFIGKDIDVGIGVKVSLDSAW